MSVYQKLVIRLLDWRYGRKIRQLMIMKMEVETLEQAIAVLNFERQLEAELLDFQNLVTECRRDLRLTGYIKTQ